MTTTQLFAARILNESPNPQLLLELRSRFGDPASGGEIVASMLSNLRVSQTAVESVSTAMKTLEAIAEQDEEIACCLMAHLWAASSQIDGAFAVSDAIDLWISNTRSKMLGDQLRFLSDASDEHTREHFRSLAKM